MLLYNKFQNVSSNMNDIPKEDLKLWRRVTETITPLGEPSPSSYSSNVADYEKIFNHEKRMKEKYQATIDLHGMTQDQAYSLLLTKIPYYISMGYKCILVVTGKGNGNESGVLKRVFNGWMSNKDFINYINDIKISSQNDGGSGAFYIFLAT